MSSHDQAGMALLTLTQNGACYGTSKDAIDGESVPQSIAASIRVLIASPYNADRPDQAIPRQAT
jgi:hypothetical protein